MRAMLLVGLLVGLLAVMACGGAEEVADDGVRCDDDAACAAGRRCVRLDGSGRCWATCDDFGHECHDGEAVGFCASWAPATEPRALVGACLPPPGPWSCVGAVPALCSSP